MSTDIVLVSVNARYTHAALGVRSLLANMGDLRGSCLLEEFVIQDQPARIAERILEHSPKIVGFSLAIWNIDTAGRAMAILKAAAPEVSVVTGGPEVRWAETVPGGADYLIRGEGETAFPELCRSILAGAPPPGGTVIDGGLPDPDSLELPFGEYSDEDLRQRIISVEASRGCPFGCEFCLSSRETKVRHYSLDRLLPAFGELLDRGCRGFKFIDRTFNLELTSCRRILDFFHERWPRDDSGELIPPRSSRQVGQGQDRGQSLFLHFEVVPDRFDEDLVSSLARFPEGGIQLEMGIQTLDAEVGGRISRRVDPETAARNIAMLRKRTGVHLHADLIMGLPGQDLACVASDFDGLLAMGPQEIQMGILKLLPGAPIARHTGEFGMVYSPFSPYEVLRTDRIGFAEMRKLRRMARYWDIFANSGKFRDAMARLTESRESPFAAFAAFSSWLWETTGQEHGMAQARQYALVLDYLAGEAGMDRNEAGTILAGDYLRIGSERYLPEVLRPFAG